MQQLEKTVFQVHHILAPRQGPLSELVCENTALSLDRFNELLEHGAVWANRLRAKSDQSVEVGQYIRVHAEPRRFPSDKIDWKATIVHEELDFLVINKPAGVPVHATVDNWRQNAIFCLEQAMGFPVYVTQRLDTATEGLLVLAKTKWFQGQFNKLLRERTLKKTYQALVETAVPLGELVHYLLDEPYTPRKVTREPMEGWLECRLIVESCVAHTQGFLVEITLLTGRTHQIRAQLSDVGAPILGDTLYGSKKSNPWEPSEYTAPESIALRAHRLEFIHPSLQTPYRFVAFSRESS